MTMLFVYLVIHFGNGHQGGAIKIRMRESSCLIAQKEIETKQSATFAFCVNPTTGEVTPHD